MLKIMNKKITRWSLMNILFAILVSIPLWSIVVRTGYVLLNKNAYQSYSGTQTSYILKKHATNNPTSNNELINGNYYRFYTIDSDENYWWDDYNVFNGSFELYGFNIPDYEEVNLDEFLIPMAFNSNFNMRLTFFNSTMEVYTSFGNSTNENSDFSFAFNLSYTLDTYFVIKYDNTSIYDENNELLILFNDFYKFFQPINENDFAYDRFEETNITTLDNVFDYSIDKFNSENDAHFDFVSTIANMFITEDSYGWRYVEFVNWYFNYFIVISAVYILFLALIWFIAVSRNLIERSMHLW